MKNTMKKLVKMYLVSFVAVQIVYMLMIGFGMVQNPNGEIGSGFLAFLAVSILILVWTLPYSLFVTLVFYLFSLVNDRILNRWLILSVGSFSFLIAMLSKNVWYTLASVAIPPIVAIIIMKRRSDI